MAADALEHLMLACQRGALRRGASLVVPIKFSVHTCPNILPLGSSGASMAVLEHPLLLFLYGFLLYVFPINV